MKEIEEYLKSEILDYYEGFELLKRFCTKRHKNFIRNANPKLKQVRLKLIYLLEELINIDSTDRVASITEISVELKTKKTAKPNSYQNLPANIQNLVKAKINLINKRKGLHDSLLQFPLNNDNEEINETRKNIGYEIDLCTNQIDELVSQIECFETTGKMPVIEIKDNEEINTDFSCWLLSELEVEIRKLTASLSADRKLLDNGIVDFERKTKVEARISEKEIRLESLKINRDLKKTKTN